MAPDNHAFYCTDIQRYSYLVAIARDSNFIELVSLIVADVVYYLLSLLLHLKFQQHHLFFVSFILQSDIQCILIIRDQHYKGGWSNQ